MSLTAGELRDILEGYPDDMEIVLSSDGEGNRISPLSEADRATYRPESSWAGELVDPEDLEEISHDDYEKDLVKEVVVLWPTN